MAKRPYNRRTASREMAKGGVDGTAELLVALAKDSLAPEAWRPVRAAAAIADAARRAPKAHVWMTTAECVAWMEQHFPAQKAGRRTRLAAAIGMSHRRYTQLMSGESLPTKCEALAMAHYALFGDWRPLLHDISAEAFADWFVPRFGLAKWPAAAIQVGERTILGALAGFQVRNGVRVARAPEPDLIRALDWVLRVGTSSPYGHRVGEAFPGQAMEG